MRNIPMMVREKPRSKASGEESRGRGQTSQDNQRAKAKEQILVKACANSGRFTRGTFSEPPKIRVKKARKEAFQLAAYQVMLDKIEK